MSNASLLRYNFRVLMFHNGWLLAIPLAVSQLTIFWTAATQRFAPAIAVSILARLAFMRALALARSVSGCTPSQSSCSAAA